MTAITTKLSAAADVEWVGLWKASTHRLRVFDPVWLLSYLNEAERLWAAAGNPWDHADLLRALDDQAGRLADEIQRRAQAGLVNTAPREALMDAAGQGALAAYAERRCVPYSPVSTHPAWHLAMTLLEGNALDDAGLAGAMALQAAYFGQRQGIDWAGGLDTS